jgi:hypothetical protein
LTIYPYYLILFNIHIRYVELHHLQDRSTKSDNNLIKFIFNDADVKCLESEKRKIIVSSELLVYLKKHKIDYYVITEQQHQSL